jgi:hypothetical protein
MLKSLLTAVFVFVAPLFAEPPSSPQQVTVASESGVFCGWPANHGPMHAWGDELLMAFTAATYKQRGPHSHAFDDTAPQQVWLARSLDGGVSWKIEKPSALSGHKNFAASPVTEPLADIRSDDPHFILLCGYESDHVGRSWFQTSPDRGKNWSARQLIPDTGCGGYAGRTDYVLSGDNDALFLMTVPSVHKAKEGHVAALWTGDGGKTWEHRAWVGPDPKDGFSIQPQTVKLSPDGLQLLTVTRLQEQKPQARTGLQFHRTDDRGKTWRTLGVFLETGARSTAAALTRLADGRVAVAYAQRMKGQICGRISSDAGATWGEEIVLRDQAGNWDIGYPRMAQRTDGKLVTTYYWNDDPQQTRTIAATIWSPPVK